MGSSSVRHVVESGPRPVGQLERQFGGYVFHTEEGMLGRISPAVYISPLGINIGVESAYSNDEYSRLISKLREKWITDYSESRCAGCILVLHSFVRPDFERVKRIIKDLNGEYSEKFLEIWYLRPHPNNIDDVRCLSC